MATKKAVNTTTALANYDAELAQLAKQGAQVASARAGGPGGNFIGTGGGRFKIDGTVIKETAIGVVVSDYILENARYEGVYDVDNPTPPTCFAFGRSEEEMVPHEGSTNMQGTPVQDGTDNDMVQSEDEQGEVVTRRACSVCWANEYGSSTTGTGKGKACKNVMRLGVIAADQIVSVESIKAADDKYIKVPPTSTKAFNKYVNDIQSGLGVAVQAQVVTTVEISPAEKGGHRLDFSVAEDGKIEDMALVGALIQKHKEIAKKIDFPYLPPDPETQQKAKPASRPAKGAAKTAGRVASSAPVVPAKSAKGFGGSSRAAKY